jgi:DNA-binding MarR family transcriptional regulator
MTNTPTKTVIRAWARLMKAHKLALTSIEQALNRAELPPLSWYDVLLDLERAGPNGLRPFELERTMLLAQYKLSRLVDRIERKGYVARRECEEDGRGHLVAITDEGKAIRRKIWPIYARAIEATIGQYLSSEQADTLDAVLGMLIEKHAAGSVSIGARIGKADGHGISGIASTACCLDTIHVPHRPPKQRIRRT